ncbi:hypothetical protein GpartN1_g4429.t1 [Galdieria partita]|uniref:ApaG domain-containing protein n=1 Tax=Galdieria partita TaxID=83374 RepID=A0A9C7UR70_9RHOD|nr:hypothetical protein GpartN1_g4429.t1 [Galdieria partita]
MTSFIQGQRLPCLEWSLKQRSRGCAYFSYYSYVLNGSLHTSRYSTASVCFASTQVLGSFRNFNKMDLVHKKTTQDNLENQRRKCSQRCGRKDRKMNPFKCQVLGPKNHKQKETFVSLSEVEKERSRLVQRIFDACNGAGPMEKVEKVVVAAGFLDSSQRLKLWFRIEQLCMEKLFEASLYNFERAAELRDEASLLRLRDAHVILQESIDEALRQGELGFAKIFYEALQLVGEPPNLKKRIPSQGGEISTHRTGAGSRFDTCLVNESDEITLASSIQNNEDIHVLSPTQNEDTRKQSLDFESSDQAFVEPAIGSLWDSQEMFGDALIDSEGMALKNNMNECREKVNNEQMNLKLSPNNPSFSLDTASNDAIGYSNSSSITCSANSLSETAINSDKDSKTGTLGEKMTRSAFSYSEAFSHVLKLQLQGKWNMERSSLSEHYLCFEYQIRIVNTGTELIQLLSSNGFVETTDGQKHTLAEKWIADSKPVVQDGESFEYSSFCVFQYPSVSDSLPFVGVLKMNFVFVRGDCGQQLFHVETNPVHLSLA